MIEFSGNVHQFQNNNRHAFPIITPYDYNFSQIFPIIQENKILLTKFPYVALLEETTQSEPEECPIIENSSYCLENTHFIDT